MKTPTFREQYDKIVKAYLRNELEPLNSCACFIGNMLNKEFDWCAVRPGNLHFGPSMVQHGHDLIKGAGYSPEEVFELETNFLHLIRWPDGFEKEPSEESLFIAMESTISPLLSWIWRSMRRV